MRYRLRTLLIAMVLLGLFCVALRTPTEFWVGITLGLMLTMMLTSVLVAIHRSGPTRAFAIGFLLFSAGYLVGLAMLNSRVGGFNTPTHAFSEWLSARIHPPGTMNTAAGGTKGAVYQMWTFTGVIRCGMACVFGTTGGLVSQWLYVSRHD